MNVNKIFRWVWRINGLVILLGSLFIAGTLLIELSTRSVRYDPEPVVTGIAADPEGFERWVLGRSELVSGSNYLVIPLVSEKGDFDYKARGGSAHYDMFSSGGGYRETYSKNLLFVNSQTDEMDWLFEGVDQFITSIDQLPRTSRYLPDDIKEKTKYIFYSVVDQDTNGDGMVNTEDDSSLAYTTYNGSGYQVLLSSYERVLSKTLDDSDQLSIIYQESGVGYLAKYSLSPYELVSNTELPSIVSQ